MPWKNGGGVTRELIRVPVSGDPFLWRVSIARIESSGPFSNFSGYKRTMVLMEGAGVRLRFSGEPDRLLREIGDLVEFDGDLDTECELLGGDCTDLNLMVSSSMRGVRAWVERLAAPKVLRPTPRGVVLALAIEGALSVEPAQREADVVESSSREPAQREGVGVERPSREPAHREGVGVERPAREPTQREGASLETPLRELARLQAWDLLVASADEPLAVGAAGDCAGTPLVFFAALDDNSAGTA
jgi:environmental stress-induced protein Ves